MAGLLVAIAVMGIMLSIIMPTWRTWAKREMEAELIFRGEQYVRAIELYQRRFVGAYPADLETLIDQRFLRKAFTDPMTGGEFELLTQAALSATPIQAPPRSGTPGLPQPQQFGGVAPANQGGGDGGGGIIGVVSSSTETSMAVYNERSRYDEWLFVYLPQAAQPGLGTDVPGDRGGVPGQGGAVQSGRGGALGGFGNGSGRPAGRDRGRGGRGGQDPGRAGRQPGVGGTTPGNPGIWPGGGPPRR